MVLAGFLQSLTELSDLQIKRVRAAVWNRIPPPIVLMLCISQEPLVDVARRISAAPSSAEFR
jgi:hypothetical protein